MSDLSLTGPQQDVLRNVGYGCFYGAGFTNYDLARQCLAELKRLGLVTEEEKLTKSGEAAYKALPEQDSSDFV